MKPIKPKKMPKKLETWLERTVEAGSVINFPAQQCREVLAALAYERQRADAAGVRAHLSEHQARGYIGGDDDHQKHVAFLTPAGNHVREQHGCHVVTPAFQREQTEAVVPKPRWHAAEAVQAAADAINADPNNPLFAKVDGLVITTSERNPAGAPDMKLPKRPRRKS